MSLVLSHGVVPLLHFGAQGFRGLQPDDTVTMHAGLDPGQQRLRLWDARIKLDVPRMLSLIENALRALGRG